MNISPWSALCSRWMTQWLSHINSSETSHFRGVTEPRHVPRDNTVTQPAAGNILWWCVGIENGSSSPVFPAQDFWHFDIISTENGFCTTQPKSVENSLCSTVRSNHWTVNAFTRWIILKSSNQILVPNVSCWLGHIGKRKFIIFSIYNSENCPREMFLRGEVFRDGLFMKVEYKRNPLWLWLLNHSRAFLGSFFESLGLWLNFRKTGSHCAAAGSEVRGGFLYRTLSHFFLFPASLPDPDVIQRAQPRG